MPERLFLTFKVTREGEAGHPMNHVMLPVDLTVDGGLSDGSFAAVTRRIQAEIRRKAERTDVTTEGSKRHIDPQGAPVAQQGELL